MKPADLTAADFVFAPAALAAASMETMALDQGAAYHATNMTSGDYSFG
jgi:hypothetical protein